MEDYKEPLRVLLKPEPFVLHFFCGVCFVALALVIYGIYRANEWVLLFAPVLFYIAIKDYKYCYQLKAAKSVIGVQFSTQDSFTLTLKNSSEVNVVLVDKFLIRNNLMLRFEPKYDDWLTQFEMTGFTFFKHQFLLLYRAIKIFALQDYYHVYLSEETLEADRFRQLLRRLNFM